ncbi:Hypothetical protein RLITU_0035 [Romboutsia lituseburensis]|uniref:Uncharacterized protein n=1 Tax=Romboutsia lituseburensis DSM 797 TaxID=1121325 RepID=A0A1G9TQB9_9FIRM|nr:Hypothetical protein RLITU_0035 [Romboutsia lituseburensis]SDM49614.1 hypothetical protein SAMN04515677_11337 [Romboutsia lituseburensis DSM 797]
MQFICREVGGILKKLKDNSGSTMVLAIFIMAIVTIITISFLIQSGNQVKSTLKLEESLKKKYQVEGQIEEELAKFLSNIKINTIKYDINKTEKIGYKIEYNKDSLTYINPVVKESDKIDKGDNYISVKENSNLDFELTIVKANENIDSNGKEFKYDDSYKIKSEIIVKIRGLNQFKNYNITYDINSWNKFN